MALLRPLGTAALLLLPADGASAAPAHRAGALRLALDYVLASCIVQHYPGLPIGAEAEAWAGGLVQNGDLPAAAYPALAEVARARFAPVRTTMAGMPMRLQGCVSVYNDPRVKADVTRIVSRRR